MDTHQGSPATAVTELQGTAEQGRLVLVEVLDRIEAAFPAAAGRHRLGPGAWLVPLGVGGDGSMLIAIAPAGRPRERGNAQLVLSATLVDRADLPEADAARALGCLEGVPFTGSETEAFAQQLPLVAGLPERVADKPLGECGVVLVGHLLSDLVVQAQTLMALGARPEAMTVLAKDYPYKLRARVEAHLASLGIAVLPVADAESAVRLHAGRVAEPSVVIDDGGHVLPTLMKLAPDLLPRFRGLVEQSLPGIEELEAAGEAMPVPVPVFSVAQSAVKRGVEAHWIAQSVVRAIRELLAGENFDGAPALVVGYGMVGEQVARVLRAQRMRVAVHDTEWRKLVAAHEAGFLTAPDLPALLDGHRPALIVSATGRTGLGGEDLDFLPGDCFLARRFRSRHGDRHAGTGRARRAGRGSGARRDAVRATERTGHSAGRRAVGQRPARRPRADAAVGSDDGGAGVGSVHAGTPRARVRRRTRSGADGCARSPRAVWWNGITGSTVRIAEL